MTIAHIICPVDFSSTSLLALEYAYGWARQHQARVRVLHVVVPPPPVVGIGGGAVFFPHRTLESIRQDVERFIAQVANPGVPVEVEIMEGYPASIIREMADEDTHALLVMGTHGRSGLDRLLMGSTTERVAHHTRRPLLVVPPREGLETPPRTTLSRILCAVDFRSSSTAALHAAIAFARETGAALDVVTVLEMLPEIETRGLGHYGDAPYRTMRTLDLLADLKTLVPEDARQMRDLKETVLTGRAGPELVAFAARHQSDLIVMGAGERGHFGGPWLGRTTDRVMRAARCPVLVVPTPAHLPASDARPLRPEVWAEELDRVTLQHEGDPTTVSIMSEVMGQEHEATALPLVALTVDTREQDRNVAVILGRPDGTRLTHFVAGPTSLRIGEARNRRRLELLITARDGTTTVVDVEP